ncbi:unnamed protein product [Arabidopsis thaliana]|uniref:Retrotransposon gag domain-containing protein n=1 Tax=Arabidopsis thaliana TaxID=3702 RepID=A0A654G5C8_ARATH|nr:unnamed protein product [Arabidopsis thaliana]
MAPSTQAGQGVDPSRITDLEEKFIQMVERLETSIHALQERQDEDRRWMLEMIEGWGREKQMGKAVSESPISSSQTQSNNAQDSCVTPTAPIKAKGDGILPLPPLALPTQQMETSQGSYRFHQQSVQQGSPSNTLGSSGRRLEPPLFEGQNLDDWLFRMEKYFSQSHETSETRRSFVVCSLNHSSELLLNTRQKGLVEEFRERFEELTVEVPHITDDLLEGIFLKGMRKNIRDQVMRTRPSGIDEIVETVGLIEE